MIKFHIVPTSTGFGVTIPFSSQIRMEQALEKCSFYVEAVFQNFYS